MANMLENQAQLVQNNTSLREQVLSMVRNLPEAGGGEDVTAETNEYTALLAEALSEIEGKAALGGNATAEDIREGKTAYVNGQLLEGLMKEGSEYGISFNAFDDAGHVTDIEIVMGTVPSDAFAYSSNTSLSREHTFMSYATKTKIIADVIPSSAFRYTFYNDSALNITSRKIKIDARELGENSFDHCSPSANKIWISKKCETMYGSSGGNSPFASQQSTGYIYCEATSKPSGWSDYWDNTANDCKATVTWGVTEKQFDAL